MRSVRLRPLSKTHDKAYTVPSFPTSIEFTYEGLCPFSKKMGP